MKQNRTPELVLLHTENNLFFYSGAVMERFTDTDSITVSDNSDENRIKEKDKKKIPSQVLDE